jgi:hypothetical protein
MSKQEFAESLGKSLDKLIEAINDSEIGQFERLKEFGIRYTPSTNKFCFRGMELKNVELLIASYYI